MSEPAPTDVWDQTDQGTGQGPDSSKPRITQANELWEFVPDSNNSGGSITSGFGQLINRQSGLCLEINGSGVGYNYNDGATIDQYQCIPGANNEEWSANAGGGSYIIYSELRMTNPNDGYNILGLGNESTCTPTGDGQGVYSRTSVNDCDDWQIQQASYDYATASVKVGSLRTVTDPSSSNYGCIAGHNLRLNQVIGQTPDVWSGGDRGNEYYYDYDNVSSGTVSISTMAFEGVSSWAAEGDPNPNSVTPSTIIYSNSEGETNYGQILLYCDPQNSNP
ncbi:MAG TPA: RICIN domain-containing protein [Solirubrobacteraceae bacterium]|nr:RICIN domain-containing protein [Solirubrobacteraceae bacterium]